MPRAFAVTTIAAAALATAMACSGAPEPRAPSHGQPRVEVLDEGAEPRTVLRLAPTPGTSAGADVVVELHTRTRGKGDPPARMAFGWTGEVKAVSDTIRVDGRFDRLEIDGAPADHQHVAFAFALLPTGAITALDVPDRIPARRDAALAEATRHALTRLPVFPPTPIGLGARWTVATEYVQSGQRMNMTVTPELVAHDETHARVRASIVFRAASDHDVILEGSGTVDVDVDLRRVIPTSTSTLTFSGASGSGITTITLTPRR